MTKVTLGQKEFNSVSAEVTPFIEDIEKIKIDNNEDYIKYGEIYNNVKKHEKAIKAKKESVTKPLNESLKATRALFKPLETRLDEAKRGLALQLNNFKREQDKIAAEKAKKLQDKIEKGTIKRPETIMKNLNQIEKADTAGAGLAETTRKSVKIEPKYLKPEYILEIAKRPNVWRAIEIEIRKDALGNKSQNIEPRLESGISVVEEKVVY